MEKVDFLYWFLKGGAVQCNKCNFNRATCTKKADFQPVECSLDVAYCMKADGVHEERNGQTGNVTKVAGQSNTYIPGTINGLPVFVFRISSIVGVWRDCGDPEVVKILFMQPDVKKHVHGCTQDSAVRMDMPIVDSNKKKTVSYRGTVCLCSGDNCNSSTTINISPALSLPPLIFLLGLTYN